MIRGMRADNRMLLSRMMTYDRPGALLEISRGMAEAQPSDPKPESPLGKMF